MPRGAAPGERRGGRQKGTRNKATAERDEDLDTALAAAFAALGPDFIDGLSPAMLQLIAMREAAKAGFIRAAAAMADRAAPYFDAKKASEAVKDDSGNAVVIVRGGFRTADLDASDSPDAG